MPDEPTPADESASEVSLDQLSATFARMFAPQAAEPETGAFAHPPGTGPAAGGDSPLTGDAAMAGETAAGDDPGEVSPLRILEAMLFVGSPDNSPLLADRAASVMRGVEAAEIHELVAALNEEYATDRRPYRIASEGAGYRLVLRDEYQRLGDKFHGRQRQVRLSQAAVEVLAIVAYHEPMTSDEVSRLRHTPSGAVLAQLVRRQLLRIERTEEQPKTPRYFTTQRFLDLFHLESLKDLPQSQDLS